MVRLAGIEPTTSGSASLRSIRLSYKRISFYMVPKEGFEPTRAIAHYALNVARLPFRHFGINGAKLSDLMPTQEVERLTAPPSPLIIIPLCPSTSKSVLLSSDRNNR